MRRHLLVVSEKKIKRLKLLLPRHRVKFYRWHHNIFLGTTYIHNKYMYTIRAYYLQYCESYAPHRRRQTMDVGRWTMDAGPSTPYYKLTGELKMELAFLFFSDFQIGRSEKQFFNKLLPYYLKLSLLTFLPHCHRQGKYMYLGLVLMEHIKNLPLIPW